MSLAHLGVLFLDELPEFQPNVLDALRQPLETGETVIARANHRIAYPSRIQLVAAMNPCKCGGGGPGVTCRRGQRCAADYQARISGPLLDRIDLQIEVPAVSAADSSCRRHRGQRRGARPRRRARASVQRAALCRDSGASAHAHQRRMRGRLLEEIATPGRGRRRAAAPGRRTLHLSARGFHRTLRVARTLADLDGVDGVGRMHIAEALSYRGETLRQSQAA